MFRTSNSDLEALRECQRKGALTAAHPRVAKAGPARVGQAVHAVLERYVPHLLSSGSMSDEAYARQLIEETGRTLSPKDQATFNYVTSALAGNDVDIIADLDGALDVVIERRLSEPVLIDSTGGEARFEFTPDVLAVFPRRLVIVDWKSSLATDSLSPPDLNIQLRRYAAAAARYYGFGEIDVVEVVLFHVSRMWSERACFDSERLLAEWSTLEADVVHAHKMLTDGDNALRSPVVGEHCRRCDWRRRCPAFQWFFDDPGTSTLAERLVLLEELTKDTRDALKAAVEKEEVVLFDPMLAIDAAVVESVKYDPVRARGALLTILPSELVDAAASFTGPAIRKALKNAGVAKEELDDYMARIDAAAGSVRKRRTLKVKRRPVEGRERSPDEEALGAWGDDEEDEGA